MALTPDEIRSREFHLADRGYDRAEVQAFLAEVAAQVAPEAATPWPAAEERLLLILEAAERAVERVRTEASTAIEDVRSQARTMLADQAPAGPPAQPGPDPRAAAAAVEELRERLGAALHDVEAALGTIEPAPGS